MATTALASTLAASALAYWANDRLGLTTDLRTLREQRAFARNIEAHAQRCGDNFSLYHYLELAESTADALWFEGRSWNYMALKKTVDQVAAAFASLGIRNGDIISVFMTNSPEFAFVVYALSKLGAVPSLMNSNLRGDTLLHCVRIGQSNLVVTTPDLAAHAADVTTMIGDGAKTVMLNLGSFPPSKTVDGVLPFPHTTMEEAEMIVPAKKQLSDPAVFLFTSGTTGKPKACSVKHALVLVTSCPTAADHPKAYSTRDPRYRSTRTFSCMPLFHGTTFFAGFCLSVGSSSCFCIGRKFSARNYWREVTEARTTRILYVGELCRFLLGTPAGLYDRKHHVKVAAGNGLQKDVWLAFQQRFNIPEVREFYRSTEGLTKFDNRHFSTSSSQGAGKVGFVGSLQYRLEKDQFLVKFDYDLELPYRDPRTGLCVPAASGEAGEVIARIPSMATYTDYHNNADATNAKLLRDVFEKGDIFQRSGDLLVREHSGWVRFVDRTGDTFRWKGENVSAGEIRAYISELPDVHDAVIVGKALKGYDGQAGVAAICLTEEAKEDGDEFMIGLYAELKKKGVPHYAMPRLVCVTDEIKVGDTFKHAKQAVKALQWGDAAVGKQYQLDLAASKYVPLDVAGWSRIQAGTAKL